MLRLNHSTSVSSTEPENFPYTWGVSDNDAIIIVPIMITGAKLPNGLKEFSQFIAYLTTTYTVDVKRVRIIIGKPVL